MASTSTVPAAKAGILTLIAARSAIATVQQSWGWPGYDEVQRETIYMGDAQFDFEEIAEMRPRPHDHWEEYTIPVHVEITVEGNDVQGAETRGWAIVAEIETAIRSDPSLNGAINFAASITKKTPLSYIVDGARYWNCMVDVTAKARI